MTARFPFVDTELDDMVAERDRLRERLAWIDEQIERRRAEMAGNRAWVCHLVPGERFPLIGRMLPRSRS